VFVLLSVSVAGAYVALVRGDYTASADVLVSPVAAHDGRLSGLPVLRAPSAAGEVAALAASRALAGAVRARLGLNESAEDLVAHVRARVVHSSPLVEIVARAAQPDPAILLANAFADLLVAQRAAALGSAVADATSRAFDQLVALPARGKTGERGVTLRARLARLRSLAGANDTSLRVVRRAVRADEVKPREAPILAGALIGSAFLGGAAGLLAIRRRGFETDPVLDREYDPLVSEEVVAQLEQRLAERIDALIAEQERLAAREAELAERERALASGDTARDERTHGLDERLKVLTTRELELVKRAGAVSAREKEIGARDERLGVREHRITTRENELRVYAEELERLARDIESRTVELDERAAALESRAAELEARASEVEARADRLETRETEVEEAPSPPPRVWEPVVSVPPPPPLATNVSELPQRAGQWNLNELSRLVDERGAGFPERQDEWQSYLFFLRSYAEPDGTIPSSFDWLIEEQFGALTSGHPASA
jgi:DNA repair exonuclease SbcCD ATPase subunit